MFGVADTLQCLEMGAVETLVVWEDLQVYRYTLMNSTSGESVLYFVCTWKHALGSSHVVDISSISLHATGVHQDSQRDCFCCCCEVHCYRA